MRKQKRDIRSTVKYVWWLLLLFVLTPAAMFLAGKAVAMAIRKAGM